MDKTLSISLNDVLNYEYDVLNYESTPKAEKTPAWEPYNQVVWGEWGTYATPKTHAYKISKHALNSLKYKIVERLQQRGNDRLKKWVEEAVYKEFQQFFEEQGIQ